MLHRAGWYVYLLTTTAPGALDHNQFDPGWLRGSRPRCGCHETHDPATGEVRVWDLADWNPQAGKCWNRLRTALRNRCPQLQFHRFTEVQDGKRRDDGVGRGALHHHTVIVTPERLGVVEVQDLALAAGYGCVIDLKVIPSGEERDVARYVAKYVSKGSARDSAPWNGDVKTYNRFTGQTTVTKGQSRPTYQTHSSSRDWGITLKEIRATLRLRALANAARLLEQHSAGPRDDETQLHRIPPATADPPV